MNDNERRIREYIDAWGKLPAADLADYFAEDALYCDELGGTPIRGREAIREELGRAEENSGGPVDFGLELLRVLADGDTVVTERHEWFGRGEGRREFRAVAIFELEGGLIKESRCYFDRDPSLPPPV